MVFNRILFALFVVAPFLQLKCQTLSFNTPVDIGNGSVSGVSALDAADFNQDGLLDVAVMDGGKHAEKRVFAWFQQTRKGKWIRHEFGTANLLDSFLGSAKCADMDGDNDIDLVVTSDNHSVGPVRVFLFENPGKQNVYGTWKPMLVETLTGFHANDMRIADMDNDGRNDIIIRHKDPNVIEILFQNEDSTWHVKSLETEKLGTEGFAIGNLNGDTIMDISVNGYWFQAPTNPREDAYQLFAIDTVYTKINPNTKEEIGDINNDGLNDILISPAEAYGNGKNHILAWYEAPENPKIIKDWKRHVLMEDFNNAHTARLIDIDNDNDLDIVIGQAWPPKRITIFFNTKGTFSKNTVVIDGKGIYSGAILDMDNDGDIDIVGEDTYSNKAKPWFYENLLRSSKD